MQIATVSADTAASFGITPRVAMLSYSTGTSGFGPQARVAWFYARHGVLCCAVLCRPVHAVLRHWHLQYCPPFALLGGAAVPPIWVCRLRASRLHAITSIAPAGGQGEGGHRAGQGGAPRPVCGG